MDQDCATVVRWTSLIYLEWCYVTNSPFNKYLPQNIKVWTIKYMKAYHPTTTTQHIKNFKSQLNKISLWMVYFYSTKNRHCQKCNAIRKFEKWWDIVKKGPGTQWEGKYIRGRKRRKLKDELGSPVKKGEKSKKTKKTGENVGMKKKGK